MKLIGESLDEITSISRVEHLYVLISNWTDSCACIALLRDVICHAIDKIQGSQLEALYAVRCEAMKSRALADRWRYIVLLVRFLVK
jgi:hypothetical protein